MMMQHDSQVTEERWTRGWRRLVFPGIFLVVLANTVGGVHQHSHGWAVVAGDAIVVVFCAVYLLALVGLGTRPMRHFWWCYAGLVACFVVECFFAHQAALTMLTFVGVLTIAVRNYRAIPVLVLFVATALLLPPAVRSWHQSPDVGDAASLAIVMAAMFAFFGVVKANRELTAARAEIAALAAEGERQRIARDLHDLLGHSLTTISVKAQLARRLSERGDATRSAEEIAQVEELSRRALADVRAAVAGYRETTLTGELAAGRELLRTLGIDAGFPPAADIVETRFHELFGWVVREGLTNVVRHARATSCAVLIGPDWIEILDDGIGGPRGAGNGLSGLGERVEQAGGVLSGGRRSGAGWRLRVDMAAGARPTGGEPAVGESAVGESAVGQSGIGVAGTIVGSTAAASDDVPIDAGASAATGERR